MVTGSLRFRGRRLRTYHWKARGSGLGRSFALFHATGFNALTYRPLIEDLVGRGFHVHALDFSGHGGSEQPQEIPDWFLFRDQARLFLDSLSEPTVPIGHSLGGASVLLSAAIRERDRIPLVLMDPTVLTPALARVSALLPNRMARIARARRGRFSSRALVERSYRLIPGFRRWHAESLTGYLEAGLRQTGNNELELSLPPELEARIFEALRHGHWSFYRRLQNPMLILRPAKSFVCPAASARRLVRGHPDSQDFTLDEGTHFFPMEQPLETAARIAAWVAEQE